MTRRIVLAGGSGFLGRALAPRLLAAGASVVVLTRGEPGTRNGIEYVQWDATTLDAWADRLDGCDVVMHLTGKRVDCRPTRDNIAALIRSRVEPVRLVGEAVARAANPPGVWVQASTLAIYGEGGDEILTEATPFSGVGPQQMVQVALAWERAFAEATAAIDRTVLLRMGVAIGGDDDPATRRLAMLARLGLGGSVAGGNQWLSWIDLDDLLDGIVRAIHDPAMRGLYHLTAPAPVRNREAMATIRSAVGRRFGLASPRWMTRIGAPLLGSDADLAVTGRRGYPQRLLDDGFTFNTTTFGDAVGRAVAKA